MFERDERLHVGQIVAASTLSRSAVAHHLRVLREAGVLTAGRSAGGLLPARPDTVRAALDGSRYLAAASAAACGRRAQTAGCATRHATPPERMHANQFDLLRQRRFAPFFWTQFLGAANDNVYKNALVIFVAFQAAAHVVARRRTRSSTSPAAIFILPFMLFSATAGQLADKYEKSRLIRWIKLFEIAIMVVGVVGFWRRDLVAAVRARSR